MAPETISETTGQTRRWKNLGLRFVTAVAFAFICFLPFYFGGAAWAGLVILLGLRVVWEWVRMSDLEATKLAYFIPIAGLIVAVTYAFMQSVTLSLMAIIVTAGIAILERSRRGGGQWAGLGFIYLAIPCICFMLLRGHEVGISAPGFLLVIYLIFIVIGADTGAYFGGSYFQGPKMAPKLSPKKTWSGFVSGCLAGMVMGALTAFFSGYSPVWGAVFAFPVVILAVAGDFLESGLKRLLKVKDSGGVLPGHGGLLDRLDSLILVIVVVAVLLALWPGLWPLPS